MPNAGHSGAQKEGVPALARRALSVLGAFAAIVAVLYLLDIGCIFRFFTGVACPGCGMTRAWLAVLRGDLAAAIAYHPLFWSVPIAFALVFAQERYPHARKACLAAMFALFAAFIALWVVRLAGPTDAGLLFGGQAPAGVPEDIVYVSAPRWLTWIQGLLD